MMEEQATTTLRPRRTVPPGTERRSTGFIEFRVFCYSRYFVFSTSSSSSSTILYNAAASPTHIRRGGDDGRPPRRRFKSSSSGLFVEQQQAQSDWN